METSSADSGEQFVFRESKNFSSSIQTKVPPTVLLNHYSFPTNQKIETSPILLFHANTFATNGFFEPFDFLTVKSGSDRRLLLKMLHNTQYHRIN